MLSNDYRLSKQVFNSESKSKHKECMACLCRETGCSCGKVHLLPLTEDFSLFSHRILILFENCLDFHNCLVKQKTFWGKKKKKEEDKKRRLETV